jgi:acetolactate synthase-1/2/3 large subunit
MNVAELQTVMNHRLPVKIFMLENNGYASIRQTQNAFFGGGRIGCDTSSGLALPDMLKLAHAYGYRTVKIAGLADMRTTIETVLAGDDPAFCIVRLGENEFAPKLSSRVHADGSIASSSLEDMAPFLDEKTVRNNMIKN